jgi:outer membrane immunogenic protein
MRRIFLASAALFACAAIDPASAADLPPAPLPVKAPVIAPVPVWSWSGCYLGVNGGGTRAQNDADLSPSGLYLSAPNGSPPPIAAGTGDASTEIAALSHSYSSTNNGWEAGGQVGCNAQWGRAVLGVEGDWQWTRTATAADASYAAFATPGTPVPGSFTTPAHSEHVDVTQRWFTTARARAGFTPWERVLIYATGGIAWANFQSNTAVAFATSPVLAPYNGAVHAGSVSTNQMGWVVGGGLEWALTNNWSVKAEYLYLRFDGFAYASPLISASVPFAPGYAWNTSVTPREQVARVGVNYKFDWGPVVARY